MHFFLKVFIAYIFLIFSSFPSSANPHISYGYAGQLDNHHYITLTIVTLKPVKTYWRFSGFGGIGSTLTLSQNASNIKSANILWGFPVRYKAGHYINYILPQKKTFLIEVVPEDFHKKSSFSADFSYGFCDTQCKFGTQKIDINIDQNMPLQYSQATLKTLQKKYFLPVLEKDGIITALKSKATDQRLDISFTVNTQKKFEIQDIFYILNTEYKITKPIITSDKNGHYFVQLSIDNLYKFPTKMEVLLKTSQGHSSGFIIPIALNI